MSQKRIKVLMFGWELPPFNSGGLGVACYGLGKALSEKGIDITFVLPRKVNVESDFMRIIFASDIKAFPKVWKHQLTYTFPALYKHLQNSNMGNLQLSSLLEEVEYYADAAELIAQQEDFDIIHAHDWLSFPAAMKAQEISGKPFVSHIHATELDRTGSSKGNQDIYDIEKEGMQYSDKVVAVSNLTKNVIVENYAISSSKVAVVHNGVELTDETISEKMFELKKDNKIVLFVGRLTLQKGPDYFLKAAKKVLEHEQNVLFVMVGSGDMKEKLIRDAITLGISDKVIFTGFLRDSSLKALYAAADLFVMPSVSEPFGITGLESAINGTPVLVSKQSGVSEVLHHALQVDFWDIDEMTNKILAVISYAALKKTLKKNVAVEAHQQTWDKSAEKIRDVYRNL
ncbi:MAG TPA: glycosyltransferase family 4 protein, partial [Candidatus Saccharimonadales bacterium]|nr:glycosyltransferase family 4 protein [Candidatus Saccharimonadales bacterium]